MRIRIRTKLSRIRNTAYKLNAAETFVYELELELCLNFLFHVPSTVFAYKIDRCLWPPGRRLPADQRGAGHWWEGDLSGRESARRTPLRERDCRAGERRRSLYSGIVLSYPVTCCRPTYGRVPYLGNIMLIIEKKMKNSVPFGVVKVLYFCWKVKVATKFNFFFFIEDLLIKGCFFSSQ